MKEIIKYPNYKITKEGKIWSNYRGGRWLKLTKQSNGYIQIELNRKHKYVHRLVAQAFIHNPENKPYIHHIDHDKTNNHISNLIWVTQSENMQFDFKDGYRSQKGSKNNFAKLNEQEVKQIRLYINQNKNNTSLKTLFINLSKKYNVHFSTIERIHYRYIWKNI